jgi:ribonuclease P protein component
MPTLIRLDDRKGNLPDEAHVSTEHSPPQEDAWLSRAHGDQGRAADAQAAPGEGTQTADRLTGLLSRHERLTSRADFQALFQQGKRIDRPSLIVLWRASGGPRRAGFAVSRTVRGAVQRNRVKRRLREAYRVSQDAAPPSVELVVVGRPVVLRAAFTAVLRDMRTALGEVSTVRRPA